MGNLGLQFRPGTQKFPLGLRKMMRLSDSGVRLEQRFWQGEGFGAHYSNLVRTGNQRFPGSHRLRTGVLVLPGQITGV